MSFRTLLLSSCVAGALTFTLPLPAEACDRASITGIDGFDVLPVQGSEVPRTARVWIHVERFPQATDAQFQLVDDAQQPVEVTSMQIELQSEGREHVMVLTPTQLLTPGKTYSVRVADTELTTFTASVEEDHTAPVIDAAVVHTQGMESSSGMKCGAPSLLTVSVAPAPDLAMIVGPTEVSAMPTKAYAIAHQIAPTAAGLSEGSHEVRVLAVDLSGNFTTSDVIEAEISDSPFGCSSTRGAPLLWLALPLLLLVLRGRYAPAEAWSSASWRTRVSRN